MNLGELIIEALTGFVEYIMYSLLDPVMTLLSSAHKDANIIMEMDIVKNGVRYVQLLAFALLVVKSVIEGFGIYILYQNGDPDASPGQYLSRVFQAGVAIAAMPTVIRYIYIFSTNVTSDIVSLHSGELDPLSSIVSSVLSPLIFALSIIIILVALIVVLVQVAIRGAELSLMLITAPFYSLNLTTEGKGLFSSFVKHVLSISLTQCVQIFMIRALVVTSWGFGLVDTSGIFLRIAVMFGWIIVIIKSPKFLNEIMYSSGIGNAATTVIKTLIWKKL